MKQLYFSFDEVKVVWNFRKMTRHNASKGHHRVIRRPPRPAQIWLVIFCKIEGKENNAITMAKFIRNWVLRISVQNINYSHPLVAEITRTFVGN